jgi:hypothetical protein
VDVAEIVVEELAEHLGPVGDADPYVFTADKGGVRRQGLEPRTIALREPEGRFLGLRRLSRMHSDLGVCLPLLSAGDPGCRSFAALRGPAGGTGRARPARTNVAQARQRLLVT